MQIRGRKKNILVLGKPVSFLYSFFLNTHIVVGGGISCFVHLVRLMAVSRVFYIVF
jgi:hypothetical protein